MIENSGLIVQAVCYSADMVKTSFQSMLAHYEEPAAIYRPRLFVNGNQWCALYGDNLHNGVAGFGDSPALAMADFNSSWHKRLDRTGESE